MKRLLFTRPDESSAYSLFLLIFRIIWGGMLMIHGLDKFQNYIELVATFPDPLGIGKQFSLLIVAFTELFFPIGIILGLLYRICLIPMIIVMGIAFFWIGGFNIYESELSLLYLLMYIMMFVAGPGEYSIDARIYRRLNNRHMEDSTLGETTTV